MSIQHTRAVPTNSNTEVFVSGTEADLPLSVEFTGGLELIFVNQRKHHVLLPVNDEHGQPANMAYLIRYICKEFSLGPREEMFVMDKTIRPGILVLINDADWELEGSDQYRLQAHDNILFVSTLHGG